VTSLLEQARTRQRPTGPECGVVAAKRLHPELAGEMDELFRNTPSPIRYQTASELLKELDPPIIIPASSVSRHARGLCGCGK
jgi:hypothetical protein